MNGCPTFTLAVPAASAPVTVLCAGATFGAAENDDESQVEGGR